MSKFAYLDFEYTHSSEEKMTVVCVSVRFDSRKESYWLLNILHRELFIDLLCYLERENYTLVSYNNEAEASSLISLDFDPLRFQWIDLFAEYRYLQNHNKDLLYGKQYIDGRVKSLVPFAGEVGKQNLSAACYKLIGKMIDSERKDKMREILIAGDLEEIEANKKEILEYCESDVEYLPLMLKKIMDLYRQKIPKKEELALLPKEARWRAETFVRTAKMVRKGYPVNVEWARNLASNVPNLLLECVQDINSQFPNNKPFRFEKGKYVQDTKVLRQWIIDNKLDKDWPLTDGGKSGKKQLSLALESWEDRFPFRHDFPRGNFGAQIVRYLKLNQQLRSFNIKSGKDSKTFFDTIGSDDRSRAYLNPYGSQSGRYQPGSTGFLFLKSAWMRSMCQPKPGRLMGGIDFSSQEFLLSAIISKDKKMYDAYCEGDVYLYYAKGIGLVPKDGTKKTHPHERDLCKSTVLGLSYLMTKIGLSKKLTADTGKFVSEDEAQKLVDGFDRLFPDFTRWKEDFIQGYWISRRVKIPDGWTMWGDNKNKRSVANCPIQGCLHGDSRVLVKDRGYQKISDLVGLADIQVWEGEKFVRADCVPSGPKRLVKVHLRNGQIIQCSPEHKFWCIDNEGKGSWKTPDKFMKTQRIRRSYSSEDFDSEYIVPYTATKNPLASSIGLEEYTGTKRELGIVLGRLASDGWVSTERGLVWAVAEHEKNILQPLKEMISKFGLPIKESTILRPEQGKLPIYQIKVYSKKLSTQLAVEIDIKNSLEHPYLWHSKELMRGFIEGYVDGDGTVVENTVKVAFGRGQDREKYARDLQKMFHVFEVPCKIYPYEYRTNLGIRERDILSFFQNFKFLNQVKQSKVENCCRDKEVKSYAVGSVELVEKVDFCNEEVEMFDIANCPDQRFMTEGLVTHNTGSAILRKTIQLAQDKGLDVCIPLHDACYIEFDEGDLGAMDTLRECMFEAFHFYFEGQQKEWAKAIRFEGEIWGPGAVEGTVFTPKGMELSSEKIHVDKRGLTEYNLFSKFFTTSSGTELL